MKNVSKYFLVMFAISVIAISSVAAEPSAFDNSVGVYGLAGINSPYTAGVQFQRWCTNRIGFQTQGYVYYDSSIKASLNYNVSAQFLLKLFETEFGERTGTCLYSWLLVGNHGYDDSTSVYNETTGDYEYSNVEFVTNIQAGIGFGFDIMFLNHLSVPIEFGYMGEFPNDMTWGFVFGTGIRYRF